VREAFLARSASFKYSQKVNKAVWSDLQRFDLNPELTKLKVPTLVVTGRYDFNVAPSVAWSIHKAISGSEFSVFEKSGHLPFCEEVDDFVARVPFSQSSKNARATASRRRARGVGRRHRQPPHHREEREGEHRS
jgi:pimeloyl-ACP methyl ester carboxylesterase